MGWFTCWGYIIVKNEFIEARFTLFIKFGEKLKNLYSILTWWDFRERNLVSNFWFPQSRLPPSTFNFK